MNTGSVVKICTVCVMLLYSLAFSTLPFFTQIFNKGANAINLANCFSAGVLLSVALLHILPNADELLWKSNGEVGGGFPWPFCCTIISYTMVLILDKCFIQSNACLASQKSADQMKKLNRLPPGLPHLLAWALENPIADVSITNPEIDQYSEQVVHCGDCKPTPWLGPTMILSMIDIHSVFLGLALGVTEDQATFIAVFFALIGHKWVEAQAVGIEFSKAWRRGAISRLFVIVNLGLYCCGCSIGIGIGMLLGGAGLLWDSIFLGLSSGVFILVSTTELIPEQFTEIKGGDGHESKWKKGSKFISYCAGVLVMCAFWYFGQNLTMD